MNNIPLKIRNRTERGTPPKDKKFSFLSLFSSIKGLTNISKVNKNNNIKQPNKLVVKKRPKIIEQNENGFIARLKRIKTKILSSRYYLNHKYSKFVLLIALIIILISPVVYFEYKDTRVKLNNVNYLNKNDITLYSKEYLRQHPYFRYSEGDFKSFLLSKNNLIADVHISKSFIYGNVIDIEEITPLTVIVTPNGRYIYTNEEKLIPYFVTSVPLIELKMKEDIFDKQISKDFIIKSISLVKKLREINIIGTYDFDNFGNLSILTIDKKLVIFDLKEKYFSIDEQVKVLQNVYKKTNFSEIDLRFKYLVIKP